METILTLENKTTKTISYYTWDKEHSLESLKFFTQLCKGHRLTACSGEGKIAEFFREEIRLKEIDHKANRKHTMNILKLVKAMSK